MIHRHRDQPTETTPAPKPRHSTKYLKVIPKKMAIQAVVVAVATGALLMDSKFVSRRMARRYDS